MRLSKNALCVLMPHKFSWDLRGQKGAILLCCAERDRIRERVRRAFLVTPQFEFGDWQRYRLRAFVQAMGLSGSHLHCDTDTGLMVSVFVERDACHSLAAEIRGSALHL